MSSVSIRELSRNASSVIRRVAAGATVEVTSHGKVVAVISPVAQRERAYAALVSAGLLTGGSGNLGAVLSHEKIQLPGGAEGVLTSAKPRLRLRSPGGSPRAADVLAQLRDADDRKSTSTTGRR